MGSDDIATGETAAPNTIDYLDIAMRFLDATVGSQCVYWNGHYWVWKGTCYEQYGKPDDLRLDITEWLGRGFRGCSNTRRSSDEIEFQCRANLRVERNQAMPARLGSTAPTPAVISLSNGLLDLNPCREGGNPDLMPHTAEWFCTSSLPFAYVPSAQCPQWLEFLNTCLEGDQQRIQLLQEWFGYCCTHDTSYEKALFMEGPGANGKSQAIIVLERLVGEGNCSAVSLEKIGVRFQDYGMLGRLVNFSAETPSQCFVNVAALKQLISGDKYQFEPKGVDPFMATPTARLVISMNARPKFFDPTNAFWRRVMLMPWTYTVPEGQRVLNLGRKIADAELPGIFLWAIEGLKRLWSNRRFTESSVVNAAVEALRHEADPERSGLIELFESSGEGFLAAQEAFDAWQGYCNESPNPVDRGTPVTLAAAIKRVFPNSVATRRRIGGHQIRGWDGVRRKPLPAAAC